MLQSFEFWISEQHVHCLLRVPVSYQLVFLLSSCFQNYWSAKLYTPTSISSLVYLLNFQPKNSIENKKYFNWSERLTVNPYDVKSMHDDTIWLQYKKEKKNRNNTYDKTRSHGGCCMDQHHIFFTMIGSTIFFPTLPSISITIIKAVAFFFFFVFQVFYMFERSCHQPEVPF